MNNKLSVSYGYGIEKINEYDIKHICTTDLVSSGGPILNLLNNKIIGIHKGSIKKNRINKYNIGTYLKYPLNEINKLKNEIKMKIKIEKDDINKEIYFLDNTHSKDENGIKHYHGNLKELNNINTELYINNIKKEYKKYFIPEKKGIYTIELIFNIYIKDCSYMFFNCDKLIDIDLSSFNISNINNMRYMFVGCKSSKSLPDISKWDTKNVNNMSGMFGECKSLKSLPDISQWDTKNVKEMSDIFSGCESLESLPDISQWNTKNLNNMSGMFQFCKSLESLPDISKWDTKNVNNMSQMFSWCISLESLPDISKLNTKNVINMSGMFVACHSLESLPDISKWDTKNVNYMNDMFYNCNLLKSLPDISKWDTKNVNNMSQMFRECKSLESLPDISKWNTKNATNMSYMFDGCNKKIIPEKFKYLGF